MRVWRICMAEHAATAFTGEGAVRYAGRWHRRGTPVVYTSESLALAALEQLVNIHRNELPPGFVCFDVGIPDDLALTELHRSDLPDDWRRHPPPPELAEIGTRWVLEGQTACLEVPSAIVPSERNVLLNPRHRDFSRLTIDPPEPFAFDPRLAER